MSALATADTTAEYAAALDAADPLAAHRAEFVGADTSLVYFDGNSLGRPLAVTGERLRAFVEEEWGSRLIRGWDERWYDLPLTLGDEIGRVSLGAAPGQTTVGRLDHGAALQAHPRRRRRASGPQRDRHRLRQLPDRPLHRGGDRRRARTRGAVDRGRARGRCHRRAGARGRGGADGRRGPQPGRLPLGPPGRRRGHHARDPRRRCARGLGPVPLGRLRPRRARPLGRGPRGGLHLQVPQRRTRVAGLRLRRPAPPRRLVGRTRPPAAHPGLDGPRGPVPHGSGLPAVRRHPTLHLGHARRRRHARHAGHAGAARPGRHRRRPCQVEGPHVVRRGPRRRLAGRARRHPGVPARPRRCGAGT